MGAGSSTEQRSPEQPEAGSTTPAEPQPSGGGDPAAEAAPGAPGDPAIADPDPATKGGTRAAVSAAGGSHLCRGSPGEATAPSAVIKSSPGRAANRAFLHTLPVGATQPETHGLRGGIRGELTPRPSAWSPRPRFLHDEDSQLLGRDLCCSLANGPPMGSPPRTVLITSCAWRDRGLVPSPAAAAGADTAFLMQRKPGG